MADRNENDAEASTISSPRGSAPSDPEPLPRKSLGVYRLERRIGSGAMGEVYEATHTRLNKRVAIKTLRPEMLRNPEVQARFLREGETASRIRHPHVVDITDLGEADGVAYLVMEYLDGAPLSQAIEERPLSVEQATDVMLAVVDGVANAHDNGVIHRDLKPDNIFLVRDRAAAAEPKVLDFGISKVLDDKESQRLTATTSFLGTPFYMSPEQASGGRDVDGRTDQYALGVVMYEALVGENPYGSAKTLVQLIHAIVSGDFQALRTQRPDLPVELERVIHRAMQVAQDDRFPTVRSFGRALLPFASERARQRWAPMYEPRPGSSPSPEPVETLPGVVTTTHRPPSGATDDGQLDVPTIVPGRRSPVVLIAASVSLLAGIGLMVFWGQTSKTEAPALAPLVPAPPALAPAPPADTFDLVIVAHPASASIELDGREVGRGEVSLAIPKRGVEHILRVSARGYQSRTLTFEDEPPSPRITLERVSRTKTRQDEAAAPVADTRPRRVESAATREKRRSGSRREPARLIQEESPPEATVGTSLSESEASTSSPPQQALGRRKRGFDRTDNVNPWEEGGGAEVDVNQDEDESGHSVDNVNPWEEN